MKHDYDTTLARIAGNIAAGIVGRTGTDQENWIAHQAIMIARAIVEELKRPEPEAQP